MSSLRADTRVVPAAIAQQQQEVVPFVLEADEMARLQASSGLPLELFLASLVKPTLAMARVPISGFSVGAVGLGSSGRVYRGVTLEFPGLPLQHSVHSEQCLVANAGQHGEERLRFIAVSATPCGHCRQFLQELRGAGEMLLVIVDSEVEMHQLPQLLPRRFGPDDLLAKGFPLLEPHAHNLFLLDDSRLPLSVTAERFVLGVPCKASSGVTSLAAGASDGLRNVSNLEEAARQPGSHQVWTLRSSRQQRSRVQPPLTLPTAAAPRQCP